MEMTEKEYNGYLFDQLELAERILKTLDETQDIDKVRDVIKFEMAFIKRKLYQNPPLFNPE